jgi:hypothetical protein
MLGIHNVNIEGTNLGRVLTYFLFTNSEMTGS